jgi:outer membrane protein assembly factor BamB
LLRDWFHFGLALASCALWAATVRAQPEPDETPRVVVRVDHKLAQALAEAEAMIARGEHLPAVKLLQSLLDSPEDFFLDDTCRVSLKGRTLELLRSLPDAARRTYELEYGTGAAELRDRGFSQGDEPALRETVRRYSTTGAGADVLDQLGARAFDSGDFLSAAVLWELLHTVRPAALSPTAQVRLAIAWKLAQHSQRGRERLAAVSVPSVRLKGQDVPLPKDAAAAGNWLRAQFGDAWSNAETALADWNEVRGGGTRHRPAQAAGPIGGPIWQVPVVSSAAHAEGNGAALRLTEDQWMHQQIEKLLSQLVAEDKLTIPAAAPIVHGETVVLRSLLGLVAVDRATGGLRWRAVLSDPQLQRSRQAIDAQPQRSQTDGESVQEARLNALLRDGLFRDATRGSLSTDGRWVYAIEPDDVPISAIPEQARFGFRPGPTPPPPTNKLVVYELAGGRLVMEIGGQREEPALPFGGAYFLGPPLIHDGHCFFLVESRGQLQLWQMRAIPEGAPRLELEWSQAIAAPQRLLSDAPLRRMAGLSPSVAGPLLICPTAAGLVVAVDPLLEQLRWGYQYESLEPPRPVMSRTQLQLRLANPQSEVDEESGRWLESAPVIAGGCVLLTPRDSTELHCLDVLDGQPLWKRPRGQGLFIAGVSDDRVVIIGRNQVESFRLQDGTQLGTPTSIPAPSGRGLLLDGRYLLPLSTGEIATLDLSDSRIVARSRLEDGQLPGNLAASHGALISQSVRELVGFSSQRQIDADILARLANDPRDAQALGWRGELRLHRGALEAGLADLRVSQQQRPDPRTSRALAGALLQVLRIDFAKHRAAVDELERLTLERAQKHEFLRLYAEGLAAEGRNVESLQQYVRLAESAGDDPLLERVDEVLAARSDRVIRGRVQSLYQAANPSERQRMEAEIGRLAQRMASAKSIDIDRRFLRYFAQHSLAAEVQRRVIAHELANAPGEAQRSLLALASSRDPLQAGYASAELARFFGENPYSAEARPWMQRLATEYSSLPVLDGKSGGELLGEWHVDAAAIASAAAQSWPEGDPEVERITRLASVRKVVQVEVMGTVDPRYAGWSFELMMDPERTLIARDAAGRARWSAVIPTDLEEQQVRYSSSSAVPRLFTAGSWLALSLGTKFVVWESLVGPSDPRYCWQYSLAPSALAGFGLLTMRPEVLPNGRRRLELRDPTGFDLPGQLLGLTTDSLVYQMGTRLIAADPATGGVLWVRQNVPKLIEASVDEAHVTLFDVARQQAHVYRTVDGMEVAQRSVGRSDEWLWFSGERLLTLTRAGVSQRLSMHSLATGRQLWSQELGLLHRCRVVDNAEVLLLEPEGLLQNLSLEDGRPLWEAALPALNAIDYLWARRVGDRYDLVIRQPTPQADTRRIAAYDVNQIPFAGTAAAVDGRTGELLWKADVGLSAFDVIQPAQTPILAFAGRVTTPVPAGRGETPLGPGLSATFIDARSGTVVYQTWESSAPAQFHMELNGDRQRIAANFMGWVLEFRWDDEAK